jgi:glycolate oxidase FAD binding subunit
MIPSLEPWRSQLAADAIDGGEAAYRYAAAGVVPQWVLQPASIDEVCRAVRAARADGLALIPSGSGTHLRIGWPPRRYDAALSVRRLERIVAHDAADMTVTVEAGVTIGALARALAEQGQWLPIDPPRAAEMTVGGLLAADRSGPLRLAYGKPRDWLIGVRAVTGEGEVVRGGGRVVKNVAGYDLPKLFTGSFGTLGVIVEATFKVRPLPAAEALFTWPVATLGDALRRAVVVEASGVFPVLLEAVNEAAAESLGLPEGNCLLIGCAGAPAHIDEQARRLRELSAGDANRLEEAHASALRRAVADFSEPANEEGIVARLSGLPTVLAALLPEVEHAAQAERMVAEITAHAGVGVACCQLLGAPSDALAAFATWLRSAARARGAWAVFEALPPELCGVVDPWGFDAPSLRLMRGVKRVLDPAGIFSPGRFVGGI